MYVCVVGTCLVLCCGCGTYRHVAFCVLCALTESLVYIAGCVRSSISAVALSAASAVSPPCKMPRTPVVLISPAGMACAMEAALILGFSQDVLRIWIDQDVVQEMGRLTHLFLQRFVELLGATLGLQGSEPQRVTVQTAIAHLHMAHLLGSGLLPDDWVSVRNTMDSLLDSLQIPVDSFLDVRSKIHLAISKMIRNLTPEDGLELDKEGLLAKLVKAKRNPKRGRLRGRRLPDGPLQPAWLESDVDQPST